MCKRKQEETLQLTAPFCAISFSLAPYVLEHSIDVCSTGRKLTERTMGCQEVIVGFQTRNRDTARDID